MIPRATYRLQFSKDFRFKDAARIAPYLAELGVSDIYASPYLKARAGSPHGYDIVDHNSLNPELGDEDDFNRMCDTLKNCGLGHILDFVPNHMGVGGSENPFWLDVLEWGRFSTYAGWFDIDWEPGSAHLHDKVLVPFLGEQYGAALQNGNLALVFDRQAGAFAIWAYGAHKFPVSPFDYKSILGDEHPLLERAGDDFASLGDDYPQARFRAAELKTALAKAAAEDSTVADALNGAVSRYCGRKGDLSSWMRLDQLIGRQHWRPAHFRVAADDVNYRRFFNINDLAGIRMELHSLFESAHKFVIKLVSDGILTGLRIDHIDGLSDPRQYLQRLRDSIPQPLYLVVEKILAPYESLPEDWPIDGTTGYDFLNEVNGLLVSPADESPMTAAYGQFVGSYEPFDETVRVAKLRIADNEMAGELQTLARDSARVARQNPATSDFTENILRRALRQIVACFPVYRTYISDTETEAADLHYIDWAIKQACRHEPDVDQSVFDFLRMLLTANLSEKPKSGYSRHSVLNVVKKFQQFTSPVMAKGFEDTALYRYNRLIGLNEVGGAPSQFGVSVASFHKANSVRAEAWPATMLSTATHDTKHGEDMRARLAVLSEIPDEWLRQVETWSRILRARRGDLDGSAPPARNDEYLLYQLLVGSWPAACPSCETSNSLLPEGYLDRLQAAMQKSIREERIHSGWIAPNEEYEAAVQDFIDDALDPVRSEAFLNSFQPFAKRVAQLGMQNSLTQLVLKLTSPGVPDIYQGSDLWNFSFMDPDNRRAVDYESRKRRLREINLRLAADRRSAMRDYFEKWEDGSIKLAILATLLKVRREVPALFGVTTYEPISCTGPGAHSVCAFSRIAGMSALIVAVKLYPATAVVSSEWERTHLALPDVANRWVDTLLLQEHFVSNGAVTASAIFADLPVVVLLASTEAIPEM